MKVSVIIPCYNEAENIPLILKKFQSSITNEDIEVIIVNNGSTDNSENVLSALLPNYSFARSTTIEKNRGYGYGILYGLKQAKGEFLGWTHADMQTDPADIIKAYHVLEDNGWKNIYIKGSRRGRSLSDCIFTFGMGIFETLLLKKNLFDINAQPNIFSRKFYNTWDSPPCDFSLDLYALYMAKTQKLRIIRFKVEFPPRIYGNSHWNDGLKSKIKFIKRTILFSFSLKNKGIR